MRQISNDLSKTWDVPFPWLRKTRKYYFMYLFYLSTMWRTFYLTYLCANIYQTFITNERATISTFRKKFERLYQRMKFALTKPQFHEQKFKKINDEHCDWSLNSCECAGPELTGRCRVSELCRRSHLILEEAVRFAGIYRFTGRSAPVMRPQVTFALNNTFNTEKHFCHFRNAEDDDSQLKHKKKRENCETLWRQTHCYRSVLRARIYFSP